MIRQALNIAKTSKLDILALMLSLDRQRLETVLGLLGELLAVEKKEAFHLVVCGGSALIARGVVSRATQDVDLLALRNWDLEDLKALAPDAREIEQALRWVLREIPGLAHRERLPEIVTYLGHAGLDERFQK